MFRRSLGIHLSPDCNLRCPGCYLEKRVEKGDVALLGSLLQEFASDREVWVAINSGHRNADVDVRNLNLNLHGLTTTPDVIQEFNSALIPHFRQINISIDAFKMRHYSLEDYREAFRMIGDGGVGGGLSVICYRSTNPEYVANAITSLLREFPSTEIYLLVLKGVTVLEADASTLALLDLHDRLTVLGVNTIKLDNCLTLLSNCQVCEAGTSTVDVEINGNVSSCSFLKNVGNIFTDGASVLTTASRPAGPCHSMRQFVRT